MIALADGTCVLCGAPQRPEFRKHAWTFARCGGCGLLSLQPLPDAATLAAHHDLSYRDGHYAVFAAAEDVRAAIAADRLDRLRPRLPPGRWLDVGCSTGAFLAAGAAAGMVVEGLELSGAAVERARARGLTVHHGEAETFEPSDRYAAITAFDVVEHLRDPGSFVRRAAGWLDPGGALALTVPDSASPTARALGRRWFYYAAPDHVHYFTPATVRRLLEASGFEDVCVTAITKPITLAYALTQAALAWRRVAPVAERITTLLPSRVGALRARVPLGELLAIARRRGG
ncbi:MAG: class I SAM-dependent methyltransferase [Candidatus Binatia bacterium]